MAPGLGLRCHRRPEQNRGRQLQLGAAIAAIAALSTIGMGSIPTVSASSPTVLATSSDSRALQHPAEDKVAYLHDGSLLVGYFDGGSHAVVDVVKNPSSSPSVQQLLTIPGSEVTFDTQQNAGSTDIWIQVGGELVGSAPLEQIQHGTYDGTTFTWDSLTTILGTVAPGRQDPSVTWTGKWLVATWWDDTQGSNSDQVFLNWTTDMTGKTGWLPTAIQMTATGQNIVQVSIRHSAKLGATVLVYDARCQIWTRTLLDSKADPSLNNWTSEANVDGGDDCGFGFGGPQIAVDEGSGLIHVFKAVTNSNGTSWYGVTYWKGTPDATPMSSGSISWSSRVIVDKSGSSTDPPDVAGGVDSNGTVYVVWVTSVSSGSMKYATLTSPYTSASAATTIPTSGSQPRYPHIPAQAPLGHGYVPILYQSGTGPYNIVLDTSFGSGAVDTQPPTVPTGLTASATRTPEVDLTWNPSSDNVGVTGYDVYRNGSSTPLATVSGSTLSYADKAVSQLTTYTYTVDAFDAAHNHSAQSGSVSAMTPDSTPPSVPTGLTATATRTPEVDLAWTASTDNVGVSGYTIYRNNVQLATVNAPTTTYPDKAVSDATTYAYRVDAFDAAGNHSAQSTQVSATTPDLTPPSIPTGLSATSKSATEVDLSWTASTDNVGVAGYTVYRNGAQLATLSAPKSTYADTSVTQGASYSYTVDAFDAAGNHSAKSAPATVNTPDTTPPTVPTGLAASADTRPSVTLTWQASTDNVSVTGYTIYRNNSKLTTVGPTTLTFNDTAVVLNTSYTYTVDAFDAASNHSAPSSPVTIVTPAFAGLYTLDGFGGEHGDGSPAVTTSSYWPGWQIARGAHAVPGSSPTTGFVLDGYGGLHPFGSTALVESPGSGASHYWGFDIARDFAFLPDGSGGFVLDGYGGLHPFRVNGNTSPLVAYGNAYWGGWDIARKIVIFPDGSGGYVLDAYGGIHPFGTGAPLSSTLAAVSGTGYWDWKAAVDIVLIPGNGGHSGYVLDAFGGLHPFHPAGDGSVMPAAIQTSYFGFDIARGVFFLPGSATDGYTLDGFGGLHSFGNAPAISNYSYFGWDIARGLTGS